MELLDDATLEWLMEAVSRCSLSSSSSSNVTLMALFYLYKARVVSLITSLSDDSNSPKLKSKCGSPHATARASTLGLDGPW